MKNQYVFVTVGVPACGKSAFYHKVASDDDWGMGELPVYISSDDIREELCGTAYDQSKNGLVFDIFQKRAEEHLQKGHSIYLDATHAKAAWRLYALLLAKKYDIPCVALYFDVPFFTAIKRDRKRSRHVGFKVLLWYARELEIPDRREGFNAVFRIGRDGQYIEME